MTNTFNIFDKMINFNKLSGKISFMIIVQVTKKFLEIFNFYNIFAILF